ncbi:YfiT family bacillithiol transferase [Metabacillus arenae]|uniref:Putative metal-dependent hydrolase IC621_09805 n=1 Tax=Metabacillus arenae TaxID=2771434 RepID=A0A926RW87_9BACI|nr:bacillithiol transferase BstA [Metabacillus arenae]MBD1380523.1 bacillithiol transferase BstA [Metabacillus arenae]
MADLRYPIGQFKYEKELSMNVIEKWINEIEVAPAKLKAAVKNLTDDQLDTPYRSGGWTVRQVVHHIADSHINSYTRLKLSLTEENPTIKPYLEEKWAELPDSKLDIDVSLSLLAALHRRWVTLLRSLLPSELEKIFYHPDSGAITIGESIGLYAWHGSHHIAHITSLRQRQDW